MDKELKELWASHKADTAFKIKFNEVISAYKSEEKKQKRTKLLSILLLALTSIYLIVLMNIYNWMSGIKFYGLMLIILDMVLVSLFMWVRSAPINTDEIHQSSKEMTQTMIKNLNDQILYNRYILPLYGIILTIGVLMVYTDIVPRITDDVLIQASIYLGVVVFVFVLMSFGVRRKNKHIQTVVQPLINELKEYE